MREMTEDNLVTPFLAQPSRHTSAVERDGQRLERVAKEQAHTGQPRGEPRRTVTKVGAGAYEPDGCLLRPFGAELSTDSFVPLVPHHHPQCR